MSGTASEAARALDQVVEAVRGRRSHPLPRRGPRLRGSIPGRGSGQPAGAGAIAVAGEAVTSVPATPFRGIRPFRYADHAIFFARANDTRQLAAARGRVPRRLPVRRLGQRQVVARQRGAAAAGARARLRAGSRPRAAPSGRGDRHRADRDLRRRSIGLAVVLAPEGDGSGARRDVDRASSRRACTTAAERAPAAHRLRPVRGAPDALRRRPTRRGARRSRDDRPAAARARCR